VPRIAGLVHAASLAEPRRENVVFSKLSPKLPAAPALDKRLLNRARESRPRSPRNRSSRITRAGPSDDGERSSSDDPDLTPLRRGWILVLEGLLAASEGGLRSFVPLLDMGRLRFAAEAARLAESGER
jgi:hypothetical protein